MAYCACGGTLNIYCCCVVATVKRLLIFIVLVLVLLSSYSEYLNLYSFGCCLVASVE